MKSTCIAFRHRLQYSSQTVYLDDFIAPILIPGTPFSLVTYSYLLLWSLISSLKTIVSHLSNTCYHSDNVSPTLCHIVISMLHLIDIRSVWQLFHCPLSLWQVFHRLVSAICYLNEIVTITRYVSQSVYFPHLFMTCAWKSVHIQLCLQIVLSCLIAERYVAYKSYCCVCFDLILLFPVCETISKHRPYALL